MSIESLIDKTFATRNAAHTEHWKTESFAAHAALGDLYEALPGVLDRLVEARQGLFGVVGPIKGEKPDVVALLKADVVWIAEHRAAITNDIPALQNILDELSALHMTAIFKLERLK